MFLEIGPAGLVIQGQKDGKSYKFEEELLVEKTKSILVEISKYLPVLKQKAYKIKNTKYMPDIPKKMVETVKAVNEASLTPMSAVAGSVADALKKFLKSEGLDLVLVNNGGDISIFNKHKSRLNIDIGDIRMVREPSHVIHVQHFMDYGIATSGFGGRSLTLGLANSVTVVAETGAMADAAATFICNCTNTESDQVIRRKASEIDPLTDIPDDFVTISINQLTKKDIVKALENGLSVATKIKEQKHIYDTVITLQGYTVTTINGDNPIELERGAKWKFGRL